MKCGVRFCCERVFCRESFLVLLGGVGAPKSCPARVELLENNIVKFSDRGIGICIGPGGTHLLAGSRQKK